MMLTSVLKLQAYFMWPCFLFSTSDQLTCHLFCCWSRNTAGFVYLQFDSVAAAGKAQQALHGRWFAGKMITATFMVMSSRILDAMFLNG